MVSPLPSHSRGSWSMLLLFWCLACSSIVANAQEMSLPEGFEAETVVSGLVRPVDVAFSSIGLTFIAEKPGVVRTVSGGAILHDAFLDISAQVNEVGDRGLVGVELHPRFPDVPYVYLSFAYDPPEVHALSDGAGPNGYGARVSRLIRVTADAAHGYARAVPNSEVVLLGTNSTFANIGDPTEHNPLVPSCERDGTFVRDCLAADEHSHTIGRMQFGPDGALYVTNGDGTNFGGTQAYHMRGLDLDSLAGKLLRIDPETGHGLPDNPFFDGDPESNRSKVVSYGMRNPFSFTFHPDTWEPVMADVGWTSWEMVKVGAGHNFGWPCYEGGSGVLVEQRVFDTFETCRDLYDADGDTIESPAYAYNHEGTGGSIIVGEFQTDSSYPDTYRGSLFIADYYQAWIRTLTFGEDGLGVSEPFATVPFPVYLAFGPDGHLHYLDIWSGALVRLRYTGQERTPPAPEAVMRLSTHSGEAPLTVELDATLSSDPAGGALSYLWEFGSNLSSTLSTTEWFYFRGDHTVRLTVTNEAGMSASVEEVVRAGSPGPIAMIDEPEISSYATGDVIHYAGRGIAADGSDIPEERLRWQLIIHYDDGADLTGLPPVAAGSAGTVYAADRGEVSLELCLRVIDEDGMADVACTNFDRR